MQIAELPFFAILLLTILPITIGIILLTKAITLITNLWRRRKESDKDILIQLGEILLFITFLTVIIETIYYIIGEQPSGFSIFDFLIEDMLPVTWYVILMYGILINFVLFIGGSSDD